MLKETIENDRVDVTMLKAQLYQENIHNLNPTMFKRVNDIARTSNFQKEWTLEEFTRFFMA
jgi:hypothetical protein